MTPNLFPSRVINYSNPNLTSFSTQMQVHIPHVTWYAQQVRESKIDHTNAAFSVARNRKNVIVQWVGTKTHLVLF